MMLLLRLILLFLVFSFSASGNELDSLRLLRRNLLEDQLKLERLQAQYVVKDSLLLAEYEAKKQKILDNLTPEAVTLGTDTLFMLYSGIGPLTLQERIARIEQRLAELVDEADFNPKLLTIEKDGENYRLLYAADITVLLLTEADAVFSLTSLLDIAKDYKQRIVRSVQQQRASTAWLQWLFKVLLVVLVIAVFTGIIVGINKAYRRIQANVFQLQSKLLTRLRIGNYQLFDEKRASLAMSWLLKAGRVLLILLSFYLLLPVVFSIFPFTEGLAKLLFGYIWSPFKSILLAILAFIPNLFTIVVIFVVTRTVVRFLRFLATEIEKEVLVIPGFFNEWAIPTYNIVRFLLYAFMIVVIFPYLPGSDSKIFQGVSVFLGILFSLGSSSAISNMVAGLVITYMRPFRVGDVIQLGEFKGEVVEKNLLITRLRTPKNEEITIPNAAVLAGQSVNYSVGARAQGLALYTTVTIGYDVPWKKVHEMLLEAAKRTAGIVKSKPAYVLQTSLDDFYVSYQLNAFTQKPIEMPAIYSELHAHIQDVFNENGIEIMSPHYRAARDGNTTTIPANYLPPEGEAPALRVTKSDKK